MRPPTTSPVDPAIIAHGSTTCRHPGLAEAVAAAATAVAGLSERLQPEQNDVFYAAPPQITRSLPTHPLRPHSSPHNTLPTLSTMPLISL